MTLKFLSNYEEAVMETFSQEIDSNRENGKMRTKANKGKKKNREKKILNE